MAPLLLVLDATIELSTLLERSWLAWWVPDTHQIRELLLERRSTVSERLQSSLPVSLFPLDGTRSCIEMLPEILLDIDDHHNEFTDGPWQTMVVLGAQPNDAYRQVFGQFGAIEFETLPNGFACRRRTC